MEGQPKLSNLGLRLGPRHDEPAGTEEQKDDLRRPKAKYQAGEQGVLVGGVGVVVVVQLTELDRGRQAGACYNVLNSKIRKPNAEARLLKNVHYRATGQARVGCSLCTSAYDIARPKDQRRRPRFRQAHRCSGELVRVELQKFQTRSDLLEVQILAAQEEGRDDILNAELWRRRGV